MITQSVNLTGLHWRNDLAVVEGDRYLRVSLPQMSANSFRSLKNPTLPLLLRFLYNRTFSLNR
eukprot:m.114321 g.114321  ORF g.114321 m.114321 type:complete len:63 (+) comp51895_c0_seq3:123-311(+)